MVRLRLTRGADCETSGGLGVVEVPPPLNRRSFAHRPAPAPPRWAEGASVTASPPAALCSCNLSSPGVFAHRARPRDAPRRAKLVQLRYKHVYSCTSTYESY